MKVLVCGGLGFIGLNFVRLLSEIRPDWFVTILDKQTYAANDLALLRLFGKTDFVNGDICDAKVVDPLVQNSDVVINFAAESHNDNSILRPALFFETNVFGVLTLAEACRKHQTRLHHVSTDEVFGDLPIEGTEKFTEASQYRPSSPYSASKASADLLLRAWFRTYELKVTISNCTNNFGEFQHAEKLIPNTVRRITQGLNPQIYGDGSNIRDWIHVRDHCLGVLAALEHGALGETYLFGATDEVSNLELARGLIEASGRDALEVEFVQDRPGHDRRYSLDWDKARDELGWEPKESRVLDSLGLLIDHYGNR